jgi:hypothetical protein
MPSELTRINAEPKTARASIRLWISIGATLFVVALIGSAIIVPQLRVLHFFQGLIYVAVVVLAWRNSAWGFGAGFAIAVVWNGLGLFVTHLIQAGAIAMWSFLRTGHVQQLVPMMVTVGGVGHFILIAACLAAIFNRSTHQSKKWWKFTGGGLIVLAYFALIIVFFAGPR